MEDGKEGFSYTYSAKEQTEIKNIRQKYMPKELDKMEQLRRLDTGVTQKALIRGLTLGITGALIMGFGMSLAMTNLGGVIGMTQYLSMFVGIVIGVIGMAVAGLAYPIYNRILQKERERIAPEILRLTDELMK